MAIGSTDASLVTEGSTIALPPSSSLNTMRGGLTVVLVLGGVDATNKDDDDLGLVVLERIMLAALLRSAGAGPKAATERSGNDVGQRRGRGQMQKSSYCYYT